MDIFQKNLELWAKTCPREAVMLPYVQTKSVVPSVTERGEANLKKGGWTLHNPKGAVEEANKWFEGLALHKVPLVFVYGVGLGYYYDAIEAWLKKNRQRRLIFLEDDMAVISHLFQTERGTRILLNKQVQLLFFRDIKEEAVFETLYWNFSMTRLAITALTSYADHKGEVFSQLRHKIAYDAAKKNALVHEYLHYGLSFYYSFYQNILSLPGSYLGNDFFGKFNQVPAILCGAGPSLQKNLPLLKTLSEHALIFAGGSALNVLNAAGFQPHFGAGIDPNPAQLKRLSQNSAYEVPFFYRSRMYHPAFEMIHGPRLYITGAGGYDTAEYMEEKLHIEGEWLDEGHNVVNFCVEVANALGCNPIIFVGMDLAFTEMEQYAKGVLEDAAIKQSTILDVDNEEDKAFLKPDIFGKPTYTLWKWVAESDWIADFAETHPLIKMINCTEGGIGFRDIPNKPLAEVAKETLKRTYEFKNQIHGETQNSAMKWVKYPKIAKLCKELSKSLEACLHHLQVLQEENQADIAKLDAGAQEVQQSGRAALAETDLAEEPAFKSILQAFNEVYTHLMTGDVHVLSVGRYSKRQRAKQKLLLMKQKYAFLSETAAVNQRLIHLAFAERRKKKKGEKLEASVPPSNPGTYSFNNGLLIMQDAELSLNVRHEFKPMLIPEKREPNQKLTPDHILRVLFTPEMRMSHCYIEKNGKMEGQSLSFYPHGQTKQEVFYLAGQLHGPSTFWGLDGQVLAKSWYWHGKQVGKSYWYYPNGNLYSLQRYINGLWDGLQEYYYEDGSIKTLMKYEGGILTDKPIALNPDGTSAR